MSKLIPGESIIHLMESNVAGNRQGEKVRKNNGWRIRVEGEQGWGVRVKERGGVRELH